MRGDLVQIQNPRTKRWVVVDTAKGLIVETRGSKKPQIPVAEKKDS